MKFIKTISFLSIMAVAVPSVSYSVPMTPQIRKLLEEKEEKIKQLEKCDGKRKGWMIAGVSTIGLTAVGVGINIAQANKSNKLSDQIDNANQELQRHETHLTQIQSQISEKEREKAEVEKAAREAAERERAAKESPGNQGGGNDTDDETGETFVETQENQIPELDTTPPEVNSEDNQQSERIGCFYPINGSGQPELDCQNPGDWSVMFRGATGATVIKGIAACSDLPGKSLDSEATDQSRVASAYTPTATKKPKGPYCYCKKTYPDASSWVFHGSTEIYNKDIFTLSCAANCAYFCFRTADIVFGE